MPKVQCIFLQTGLLNFPLLLGDVYENIWGIMTRWVYRESLDLGKVFGCCVSKGMVGHPTGLPAGIVSNVDVQWKRLSQADRTGIGVIYQLFEIYMPKKNLSDMGWI